MQGSMNVRESYSCAIEQVSLLFSSSAREPQLCSLGMQCLLRARAGERGTISIGESIYLWCHQNHE